MSVACAAVCGVPAAHADNQSYLNVVRTRLTSSGGDHDLLSLGKQSCGLLRPSLDFPFGVNANQVADLVWQGNPELERGEAAFLVNTAIDNLCPNPNIYGYAAG